MTAASPRDQAHARRITIFIPSFGDGGVERMLVNLARGFAGHGVAVDFLVKQRDGPYLDALGTGVNLVELGTSKRLLTALAHHLEQTRPAILLSAKVRDDHLAVRAKSKVATPPRVFLRPGTTFSARFAARGSHFLKRWLRYFFMRRLYAKADGVICVSQGVADDVARITQLPPERIRVVRNPVLTPELLSLAAAPPPHPWLQPGEPPVILGAGGLRRQKNFSLLIRAFARVRRDRPYRLIILGEGRQKAELLTLADHLDIADSVALPGFAANPYAYMARAALFVLSSHWEGSPNVLVEALAVGTPVVATDCPSGPREILQAGRFGRLVPVDDETALAAAMLDTLRAPLTPALLKSAAADYTLERSSEGYLRAFGLL